MSQKSKPISLERTDYSTILLALNHSKRKLLKYMSDSSSDKTISELNYDRQKIEKLEDELRKTTFSNAHSPGAGKAKNFYFLHKNTVLGSLVTLREDCVQELNEVFKKYRRNPKARTRKRELEREMANIDAVVDKISLIGDKETCDVKKESDTT